MNQCHAVSLQEQYVQTDTQREYGFRGKIGHTHASLRNMNRNLPFPIFNEKVYTLILNQIQTPHPTQCGKALGSAAVYHLRESAEDGRVEDKALLEH